MKRKVRHIGMVGIIALLLTAVVAPTPAQAASAPTTSPAAATRSFTSNYWPNCPRGYACALVPYGSGWYNFTFYDYGTYKLSNWLGDGGALNNQTGFAAMRLLNANGAEIFCIPGTLANNVELYDIDWDPVWSIRVTSNNC